MTLVTATCRTHVERIYACMCQSRHRVKVYHRLQNISNQIFPCMKALVSYKYMKGHSVLKNGISSIKNKNSVLH